MSNTSYSDHSDSVAQKLAQLQRYYQQGRLEIALSLAESLKETLRFERMVQAPETPFLNANSAHQVDRLPPALAQWARGWRSYLSVSVNETVGIARTREPVEFRVSLPVTDCSDPPREVRVARWEASERRLREVPVQVSGVKRVGADFQFRVLFFAETGAHASATYLLLYGNPWAELPKYDRDLQVIGEEWKLAIHNEHYRIHLSAQSGEVERLVYTRNHGNELFAGGKGHGEPPAIDWGCDYVDVGGFQKLRMRNGTQPPNYEVVRGPLCVQIRRWGYPYSPLTPVFTPSRMHMDVTYTFYSGLPYFLKQGRVEMTADFPIAAMRDDEWVFSGYSFTHPVWIDPQGKLKAGEVPTADQHNLWGVGFYNDTSRDAFLAMRLEHQAHGWEARHGGVPTMNYPHHGQLWSRYPAEGVTEMKTGWWLKQTNAYSVEMWPRQNPEQHVEQLYHRLRNPLQVHPAGALQETTGPVGKQALARQGETIDTARLKEAIWKTLREVIDEQFYTAKTNIVEMGFVYDVQVRDGVVRIVLTMPHRGRPMFDFLIFQGGGRVEDGIRERVLKIPGVRDLWVETTWNPAWTPARMTDAARREMKIESIP